LQGGQIVSSVIFIKYLFVQTRPMILW
jgi:hypothetical protein